MVFPSYRLIPELHLSLLNFNLTHPSSNPSRSSTSSPPPATPSTQGSEHSSSTENTVTPQFRAYYLHNHQGLQGLGFWGGVSFMHWGSSTHWSLGALMNAVSLRNKPQGYLALEGSVRTFVGGNLALLIGFEGFVRGGWFLHSDDPLLGAGGRMIIWPIPLSGTGIHFFLGGMAALQGTEFWADFEGGIGVYWPVR